MTEALASVGLERRFANFRAGLAARGTAAPPGAQTVGG
jgi:hypothetical protein